MTKRKPRESAGGQLTQTLSRPDKVFWPDEGYTKQDLAEYYRAVFPKLQPYLADRMLSLERCPDGMLGKCFYQKQVPKSIAAETQTHRLEHVGRAGTYTDYVVAGSLATQLALVNLGCIAVHVMASRAHSPRQPDWLCIDIDPESGSFTDAARAGLQVKAALDLLKLSSFPKTSGSRGMHVLVPLHAGPDSNEALAFVQKFVARVAAAHPHTLTVEHSTAARQGRVYLDPFRNGFGQTVVAPYSVRRREKAPISTPLDWSEVTATLNPSQFNLGNFTERFSRSDPWRDFFESRQTLENAERLLGSL